MTRALLIVLMSLLGLAGCNNMEPEDFKDRKPELVPVFYLLD